MYVWKVHYKLNNIFYSSLSISAMRHVQKVVYERRAVRASPDVVRALRRRQEKRHQVRSDQISMRSMRRQLVQQGAFKIKKIIFILTWGHRCTQGRGEWGLTYDPRQTFQKLVNKKAMKAKIGDPLASFSGKFDPLPPPPGKNHSYTSPGFSTRKLSSAPLALIVTIKDEWNVLVWMGLQ